MDVVDLLMQRSSLADEQYLELLRSQDPSLRNKLFAAAQEAVNYLFHRRSICRAFWSSPITARETAFIVTSEKKTGIKKDSVSIQRKSAAP